MPAIVALLTISDAAAFDPFERQAVAIMEKHGGKLGFGLSPSPDGAAQAPRVDELHVLKFPNRDAFERYRMDSRLAALAPLREEAIAQSSVYTSTEELDYSSP